MGDRELIASARDCVERRWEVWAETLSLADRLEALTTSDEDVRDNLADAWPEDREAVLAGDPASYVLALTRERDEWILEAEQLRSQVRRLEALSQPSLEEGLGVSRDHGLTVCAALEQASYRLDALRAELSNAESDLRSGEPRAFCRGQQDGLLKAANHLLATVDALPSSAKPTASDKSRDAKQPSTHQPSPANQDADLIEALRAGVIWTDRGPNRGPDEIDEEATDLLMRRAGDRLETLSSASPANQGEAVAWLKEWGWAEDGRKCRRVDLYDWTEPWMVDLDVVVTPLYTSPALAEPDGWVMVPRKALPAMMERAAFNLCAEYGVDFVRPLGKFAEDAYEELVAAASALPPPPEETK